MIELTREKIDEAALLAQFRDPAAGAILLFLGTTRGITDGRETAALDYEAYESMARQTLAELEAEVRKRWSLIDCAIVHRLGRVMPCESSVAVAVSAAHRRDAFEAGQWLIDTLKVKVPIWKREKWSDGGCEWIHPGMTLQPDKD